MWKIPVALGFSLLAWVDALGRALTPPNLALFRELMGYVHTVEIYTAAELGHAKQKVILVRKETTPDDIHGMDAAQGILTSRGGKTSHAAVVARGMGKTCVCGAESLDVDTVQLTGHDIVQAVIRYAQKTNAKEIVLGRPGRRRWSEIIDGSMVDRLVRQSGGIDRADTACAFAVRAGTGRRFENAGAQTLPAHFHQTE